MSRRPRFLTRVRSALMLTAAGTLMVIPSLLPSVASAAPTTSHQHWAVLLCKFADQPQEPQPPSFFDRFFVQTGTGGMNDYWRTVSYGAIDLAGSVVKGWYREPYTLAQEQPKSRWDRINDCVSTAQSAAHNPFTVPTAWNWHIAVMLNAQVDSGSAGGRVVLDPLAWNVSFAAHEMGHGYGLEHSFSNDTTCQNSTWSQPGEYCDPWDIMSAMAVYGYNGSFGSTGPGLNAPYLDKLGWIPHRRIYTLGQSGGTSRTLTLAALERPGAPGYLMAKIPFDPADPYHYYTVEFRRSVGLDAGFPRDTVLIHELRWKDDHNSPLNGRSYLITNGGSERLPGSSFHDAAHGVTISVGSFNTSASTATVTITGSDYCVNGYVWREAVAGDHVCVPPATRSQAWYDNSQAAARRNPGGGPYGPDTCITGYVWREVTPSDHVCVTPATRSQVKIDNSQAHARMILSGRLVGPNMCASGYVWREATASDYVCVVPATRTQAAIDNSLAASRRNPHGGPYGPDTCLPGYVWREATAIDHVCVPPATRAQVAYDNSQAANRLFTH